MCAKREIRGMPTWNRARVAIVGVGLIGGSLGMALRERGLAETVIGIGRNPETLQRAIALGAIDSFTPDLADAAPQADLVVLATPIPLILRDLERLPGLLKSGAVVTDVGSTKAEIAAGGATHLGGAFVPGHPMAGSEKSGVEAARTNLFEGATWAITPTDVTDPKATEKIVQLAEAVGARVVRLTPESHDRAVALTSHLPHVLAYALGALAGKQAKYEPRLFDLAAGSFASATRVAHSSPELWRDISLSNRAALLETLKAYRAELDTTLAALEADDAAALESAFARGHEAVKSR
jgi:prephenate dehydrogenase